MNNSMQGNILGQFTSTFSNQQALQSLNENQILQLEIEQEKMKINQCDEANRKQLDLMR
jgi:hypothetical protein